MINHRLGFAMQVILLIGLAATGWLAPRSTAAELPWQREEPLKEAARKSVISDSLDPRQPTQGAGVGRSELLNEQLRASLWGPPDQVTLSLLKTDVWDRRYGVSPVVTLAQLREGAYSPANAGFDDMPPGVRRPVRGWLPPDGSGRVDPYACWNAYPFPCEKPVGQIILGMDELSSATSPVTTKNCSNGLTEIHLKNGKAAADLRILLGMKRNVFALQAHLQGVDAPWLRLYRHEDQAWRRYMNDDRKTFRERSPGSASGRLNQGPPTVSQILFDYAKDAAWNGPVAPPESGTDGHYFWIHQVLPAEKTFPKGFDYVMMGVVAGAAKPRIETVDGKKGLGTPPFGLRGDVQSRLEDGYSAIRNASGSAATGSLTPDSDGNVTVYVTVVTCNEAPDPFAEARRQLDKASADGFEAILAENTAWYDALYDRREQGRVFYGDSATTATENVQEVFDSWHIHHDGGNKPDMARYEATADYACVEQDWQLWHSLPCYNEIFYTGSYVKNRADADTLWSNIIQPWISAAKKNAREIYGVPDGMMMLHGYIPPVKPDTYVHTNVSLEYTIDSMAQLIRPLWDEWDYGGNEDFLRERAYPAMREAAIFYANYATKGDDGLYHFIPSVEAEAWGIFPQFKRARDTISAICMARWTFDRAAEGAKRLNVDADLREQWLAVASKLPPYPMYQTPEGPVFNSVDGTIPSHKGGDHPFYVGMYPTLLSDDVNLDSSQTLKDEMARTVKVVSTSQSRSVLTLLGMPEQAAGGGRGGQGRRGGRGGGRSSDPESLLNSRSGRIHLFPAVPAGEVVAFHNFQARGAFLVSAAKNANVVTFVEIESRLDGPCRLMNPWPGSKVAVHAKSGAEPITFTIESTNGECLVIPTKKGDDFLIERI